MKSKGKIGIFTGYFLPHLGGVERYTEKLSEELKILGYDITIITSNHDNLVSEEIGRHHIYRLPICKMAKQRYPIPKKNKEWFKLYHKIELEQFDYIICNTRFHLTSMIGAKMAHKFNIPVLLIEHGSNHFTVNNRVLDYFGGIYEHFLTYNLKKYVKHFYGVSQRCNNWLKHFGIEASGVFYNSIDDKAFSLFKDKKYNINFKGKTVLTFAGRLIKEKGIYILLDAFTLLEKKYNNICLVIAGDGPILSELKDKYKSKKIYFVGKLGYNEIMSLYNSTDIFIHPSMFPEGLPTAILEAGLMNCAIVATDRGGTIEVINNEKYGLICLENIDSLKEKIEELITKPQLISTLKKNIHKRIVDYFTWKITAKIVDKELENIKNGK